MAKIRITRVKKGEGPGTAGRISINAEPGGFYSWTGVLEPGGAGITGGSRTKKFKTVHEAEAGAVAWAMSHGAIHVLIEGPNA